MKFDPEYLEKTAWVAQFNAYGKERTVLTVHPAIILVQKLSNAWGRPPREKDIKDVKELIRFWQENQDIDSGWEDIIVEAIKVLPQEEQARTRDRLLQYIYPNVLPRVEFGWYLVPRFA